MNYFIKRDLSEYGPYSLADLQKYVASGNVLLTDLCRSEGLTEWVPVSQVIGNIPVPAAAPQPPAAGTVYGGTPSYGAPAGYAAPTQQYPPPPSLHWGVCLLLAFLTCGIFSSVWLLVQALWVKKIQPATKALTYVAIAIALWLVSIVFSIYRGVGMARAGHVDPMTESIHWLFQIGLLAAWITAAFTMRADIEDHYNSAEPIGLSLSGVMTFFFSVFYFQYHFTRINEMKRQQMGGYPA